MSTSFDASQYKVLCVDDEPNILSSLRRMLSLEGFQVATAESGATALALMEKEKFNVLLSDMQMPQMNGAQLFEAARQQHPNPIERPVLHLRRERDQRNKGDRGRGRTAVHPLALPDELPGSTRGLGRKMNRLCRKGLGNPLPKPARPGKRLGPWKPAAQARSAWQAAHFA